MEQSVKKDKVKIQPAQDAKNAANLKKYLTQSLQSFEKNKEWADFGYWLQKVVKYLEQYPTSQIPDKTTFAKRLAQCLNPNLPPIIHKNAIQAYRSVFKNMEATGFNWCEDLGIYSLGIFPLFQYSSVQVKPLILELFQKHYLLLGQQLIPSICGLVVSILPGVEEQNEGLQKNVIETLDKVGNAVGQKYFYGAIWIAILRSSKVRSAGVKYLQKKLQRTYQDPDENEQENDMEFDDDDDDIDSWDSDDSDEAKNVKSRKKSSAKPEEEQNLLEQNNAESSENAKLENPPQESGKKKADTVTSSAVKSKKENEEEEKLEELEIVASYEPSAEDIEFLKTLEQNPDEDPIEVEYPNRSSLVVNALVAALEDENQATQKSCLDFLYTHFKLQTPIFDQTEKCILVQAAINILIKKDQQLQRRIYTWLFGPPDMENKYQVTEKNEFIIDILVQAFTYIFEEVPTNALEAALPLKVLQNFYMEHDHLVESTLPRLAIPFLTYVSKYSQSHYEFGDDIHKAGSRFMENITSYFSNMLNSLSASLDVKIQEKDNDACLDIIQLIEFAFELESSITDKEENMNYLEQKDYLKSIISGIIRSISSINLEHKDVFSFVDNALNLTLNLISKFELVEKKLKRVMIEKNITSEDLLQLIGSNVTNYHFDETLEDYSTFYQTLVQNVLEIEAENAIPRNFMKMFSSASELIVRAQIFDDRFKNLEALPKWMYSIVESIKSPFPSVSIIGIRSIEVFLIQNSNQENFQRIRKLIIDESLREEVSILSLTIEKLWTLLDVSFIQDEVADVIVSFQKEFVELLTKTIANSFHTMSITEKELALRRFSTFWKLSNDMPKSNFIENGIGLFLMLEFLDDHNPLLRHTCKSWLLDSVPFLYRILDPIFEVLMQVEANPETGDIEDSLQLLATDTKQYFFTKIYDTKTVQDTFRKLKGILITANELFIKYIVTVKISDRLKRCSKFMEDNGIDTPGASTYLDLLVVICLRYIQGYVIESLSPQFQINNTTVNASACEFMEMLVTYVENTELSAKMTHFIMEPLLVVLHHAINNNDYVLQVQLLNLLKVILFQSSFSSYEGTRYQCVALLSSRWFVPNLLKGLNVDQPYVRVQFINFISMCISILTENLQKESLTLCISSILKAYFEIILGKHYETNDDIEELDSWESDNLNFSKDVQAPKPQEVQEEEQKSTDSKTPSEKFKFKKKPKTGKIAVSQKYQNQNEIYILLDGVKKILNYFLNFKEENYQSENEDDGGILSFMKDVLTFQFLLKSNQEQNEQGNPQCADTVRAILQDLYRILYIYIYCWRLSREFRLSVDFSSIGITSYSFEKYNEINKIIRDYHTQIDITTKSVKSLIISVLRPLTFQYANETINSFINYWILESQKYGDLQVNSRMIKEIEILVTINIAPDVFLRALIDNQIVIDLSKCHNKKADKKKKEAYVLNYEVAHTESQIFFFLYTYITFCHIDITSLKKDFLGRLWNTLLELTNMFMPSKSPSTHLWLAEVMFLMSQKYNPKEVLSDKALKKEMHRQVNLLLSTMANTAAKTALFLYNEPGTEGTEYAQFKTVFPLPPTVYELYKGYKEGHLEGIQAIGDEEKKMEKLMFDNIETDTIEYSLQDKYRLFTLRTLRKLGFTLIQNTYSPKRVDRIIKRTQEFMEIIFPMMENKADENQLFLQASSELLHYQLDTSRSFLIKDYKAHVYNIFNQNEFFKCSKITLKYWSNIVNWVVSMDKTDVFSEFLQGVSAFSYLFNKDAETKQKIKSFERICFIIYSGERDRYKDKLYFLLEKMGEVIKNAESSHPSLLILVLFCFRILILRLSQTTLNDLFRHIWPILLTLLMQIFNRKNTYKNPNLILAALKLIEMMDIVKLEEFYINQWVFLFDYYGLDIKNAPKQETASIVDPNSQSEDPIRVSGFNFQPYVTNSMKDGTKIDYHPKKSEGQKRLKKVHRKLIVTLASVVDENEVRTQALELCNYMMKMNEYRSEADINEVESLVEADFISLDEYIFKMN